MPAQYLPTVAWETIVRDVVVVDATHYYVSVYPENPNDPGSDLFSASVGQYLKDWIGHTYKIVEVNVGGVPLRLRVEDSFLTGVGPQQGLTGIVYQSPTGSPFLAPIRHFRLDDSALDYSRAIELDVLWSNIELKATQNTGICAETPIGIQDISIDYSTRIVTIIPPLGYFHYFTDGNGVVTKHEVTGNVSFPAFTNTTGTWYFYFDNNGNAVSTQQPWADFSLITTVLRIVWDSTKTPDSAKALTIFAEYHINDISAIDHAWKHRYGSVWFNGLDIFSNFLSSPTSPNADGRNTVIGLSSGMMLDDNLPFSITNTPTPTTFWQQDLGNNTVATLNATNSGIFKVRYKGGVGAGVVEAGTRFPFLWDIATNRPQYVNNSGVKTTVSNNNFFVYFVYGIQDGRVGHTVRITPAYNEYTNITDANAVTWETVQTQDEAARDTEIRPLYKLVFETKTSYSAGCKYSALRVVTDIRKSVITQTTSSIGAILASNVVYTPFTGISSTNVQTLGLELYNKFQGTLNTLPKYNATGIVDSKFTDDGTTPKYNANTIWHAGNSNLSTVDWTAKDLTVTTAKIGSLAGYLKGTLGTVGAVSSIPQADVTNLVSDLSSKQPLDATLTSLAAVAGVQGDLLYASGPDAWTRLGKSSTAKSFLRNSGTNNNPTWGVVTPSDITPDAYTILNIIAAVATWDCSVGLNKTTSCSSNFTLALTNLLNGMSGDLRLNVLAPTTITLPTSKLNGNVTALAVGIYHLCFVYDGTNLEFNIAKYV